MSSGIVTPIAFTFTDGETLAPESTISFGTLDFVATAEGELLRIYPALSVDSLIQGMDSLQLEGTPQGIPIADAEPNAPSSLNMGALADHASTLLRSAVTSEDRGQVLYAFANIATQLHRNPPLPPMVPS